MSETHSVNQCGRPGDDYQQKSVKQQSNLRTVSRQLCDVSRYRRSSTLPVRIKSNVIDEMMPIRATTGHHRVMTTDVQCVSQTDRLLRPPSCTVPAMLGAAAFRCTSVHRSASLPQRQPALEMRRNQFLVDRTNVRAYATVLRPSVVCNVMCVLEQKLLEQKLTAYRKSYMKNRLVPK